jgi:SNF2 family DNA or RNA helicase
MIQVLKDKHKCLVFSQFKGMLRIMSDYLSAVNIPHLLLDGDTPNAKRQQLIDEFNKPEIRVFLLSTRAGGLGLNLT